MFVRFVFNRICYTRQHEILMFWWKKRKNVLIFLTCTETSNFEQLIPSVTHVVVIWFKNFIQQRTNSNAICRPMFTTTLKNFITKVLEMYFQCVPYDVRMSRKWVFCFINRKSRSKSASICTKVSSKDVIYMAYFLEISLSFWVTIKMLQTNFEKSVVKLTEITFIKIIWILTHYQNTLSNTKCILHFFINKIVRVFTKPNSHSDASASFSNNLIKTNKRDVFVYSLACYPKCFLSLKISIFRCFKRFSLFISNYVHMRITYLYSNFVFGRVFGARLGFSYTNIA